MQNKIFEDLFVLELANNHLGNLERGLKIINDFSKIARFNNVKVAIKLQFRDVDKFIHKDFKNRTDIRYINKTIKTKLAEEDYEKLVKAIKQNGCIPMATPFDEKSVQTCVNLGIEIIKIASADINDWILIEEIAKTKKPVIVSTGGASIKNTDDIVKFFTNRNIPLAINHCVSIYPSEKNELELNQIDYLKNRYPNHTIGFSTHEGNENIEKSILVACAKGARTIERHIDIDSDGIKPSPYCSTPSDIEKCIKAYKEAIELCGGSAETKRIIKTKEIQYLDDLVRGVYAKKDLKKGEGICDDDVYLAIPLQKGQISCRELMRGEILLRDIKANTPIKIEDIDSPYAFDDELKKLIYARGL